MLRMWLAISTASALFVIFSTVIADEDKSRQAVNITSYDQWLTKILPTGKLWSGTHPIIGDYDFIVIGAGPGGCVVSRRLSDDPKHRVLLLEAGKDESTITEIPANAVLLPLTDYNWGFKAEPVPGSCMAMEGGKCGMPRGKGLGGTSLINYLMYTRGNKKDYDEFAAAGNEGWGYRDVLPYFLKSENNSIPEYKNSSNHGHSGPLHVERSRHKTILVDTLLEGARELGYEIADYTGPTQYGFSRIQANTIEGRRLSASKAYLQPVMKDRTNLDISLESHVTKILIDENRKAYGVEYMRKGVIRIAYARKEVILSAGTLSSPQILMLSGVGPEKYLHSMGIPVKQNLPVGQNMNERYAFLHMCFVVNNGTGIVADRITKQDYFEWSNNGTGILSMPGFMEGIGYVNTKLNKEKECPDKEKEYPDKEKEYPDKEKEYPDMEFIFLSSSLGTDGGKVLSKIAGISNATYYQVFRDLDKKDSFTILPMLLHPKSRGNVTLHDTNPFSPPKITFNYLDNEQDMKTLIEGAKEVLRLTKTNAFKKIGTKYAVRPVPQCYKHKFQSDEYWACVIRLFTTTQHHQSGTCKMGPDGDPTAVLDPQLRVRGIQNLRVVDASIFPKLPAAHLYAPVVMVAEKASDMIKHYWEQRRNDTSLNFI